MSEYVQGPESLTEGLSERVELRVREAVSSLSDPQREVVMRHIGLSGDARSLSRIAEELGYTLSQVKAFWRSAKRALSVSLHDVSK